MTMTITTTTKKMTTMMMKKPARRQIVAATLAGTAILGLCSCSGDSAPDVTGNPGPTIEQTIEPTASAAIDISDPLEVPAGEWASQSEGYVFSDEPQGVQEQWLAQNYPDLWDQGVRAVTTDEWTVPSFPGSKEKGTPGALVQYVGGERYEGTTDLPLRFNPAVTDGSVLSSANIDAKIYTLNHRDQPFSPDRDTGFNSYTVSIKEHDPEMARAGDAGVLDYPTSVTVYYARSEGVGVTRTFDTKDEAIAYVMGGVTPDIAGETRTLNPGEIAGVVLFERDSNTDSQGYVFDPRTGGWNALAD